MDLKVLIALISICFTVLLQTVLFSFFFGKLVQRVGHIESNDVVRLNGNDAELFGKYDSMKDDVSVVRTDVAQIKGMLSNGRTGD